LTIGRAPVYCWRWIMIGLRQTLRAFLALGCAGLAACALRANLATSSPFLPPNAPAGSAAAGPAEPVELRGIMTTPEGTAYCIYDTAKKSSMWVALNEQGNPFVVTSADPSSDSVTVAFQGRDIRLALKASKVSSAGPGSSGPGNLISSVVVNPNASDEQRRLDAVAAEVRRRRQERERAIQANGGHVPPAPLPVPNR
jgi:hypothetical protein